MEPVIGIPLANPNVIVIAAVRAARQDIIDQINRMLSGHTISSNTEEPDEPIEFCLDDNGDVDIST